MNPFRWLLNPLAALAEKPAGRPDQRTLSRDSSDDSHEPVEFVVVDGAGLYIDDCAWPERWGELSLQKRRYARVIEADDGTQHLSVYERIDGMWLEVEGPFILKSVRDATSLARKMMVSY